MNENTTVSTTIFAYIKDGATIEEIANLLIVYAMQLSGRRVCSTEIAIEAEQARLNKFLRSPRNSFNGLIEEFIFNYPLGNSEIKFMQNL